MKRQGILVFIIFISVAFDASARNAVLTSLSGKVEIEREGIKVTGPIGTRTVVSLGELFKTGPTGKARFSIGNEIEFWVGNSSGFEVVKGKWRETGLKILSGKLKFKAKKIKGKEVLKIYAGESIYSTKGASFTVSLQSDGSSELNVIFGSVNFSSKKSGYSKNITQGLGFKSGNSKTDVLTYDQQMQAVSDWSPWLGLQGKNHKFKRTLKSKSNLKNFAFESSKTHTLIAGFTNRIKDYDIEAGRTLKDVHGNLVRTEQRLIRPYPDTVQFVNLVKRPYYENRAGYFCYNGGNVSNRLDVFQTRVEFSKNLPQSLADWYSFFDSGDVIAKRVSIVASNHTNPSDIYMIGFLAHNNQYDLSTGNIDPALEDKLETDEKIYFGSVVKDDYNKFAGFGVDEINGLSGNGTVKDLSGILLNGLAWAEKPDAPGGWNDLNPTATDNRSTLEKGGDDVLYQYRVYPYCVGADCSIAQNHIWLAMENYVIANNGAVLNIEDIERAGVDFSILLDNIAGQVTLYIKDDTGAFDWYQIADTDTNLQMGTRYTNPAFENVDLVFISDAPYQMLEKVFPVLDITDDE